MAVIDTLPAQLRKVKRQYGVEGMRDNTRLVQTAQTVVLSVKPQILDQVLAEIRPVVTRKQLFISIAAGCPWPAWKAASETAPGSFGSCPNTPALLAKGMAVVTRGKKATAKDEKLALGLFRGVGEATAVKDEALMDAVTGLSGSGPAYVYLFAEALIAGGSRVGLTPKLATQLALQTLTGAARHASGVGLQPATAARDGVLSGRHDPGRAGPSARGQIYQHRGGRD